MVFLGVDAGGTKTHAVVADEQGSVLGVGRSGTGNWEGVGLEGAFDAYAQAVGQALEQAGIEPASVTAAGYGLSGLDWPSDREKLERVVARLEVAGPQVLVNDAFVALRAGAAWGVVIISGTGFTVAGRNQAGETARTLGLGYPFDDWGSAPEMAQACVYEVARAYTGRGPETTLVHRLIDIFAARDAAKMLEMLSRKGWEKIVSKAHLIVQAVFEEAQSGDPAALAVVRRCTRHMGDAVGAVARRLGIADELFDVVLAGGLFRAKAPVFIEFLENALYKHAPGARLVPLQAPPVVGGVLLAMEAGGLDPAPDVVAMLGEGACVQFDVDHLTSS